MKLSEILRAGKARIEQHGWCQGDDKAIFGADLYGYCTATAIGADLDLEQSCDAADLLKKVNGIDPKTAIADWNDAPERTVEDVYAAYDKAIAAAEAQEQTNVG